MFKLLSTSVPAQIAVAGVILALVVGGVMISRDPLPVKSAPELPVQLLDATSQTGEPSEQASKQAKAPVKDDVTADQTQGAGVAPLGQAPVVMTPDAVGSDAPDGPTAVTADTMAQSTPDAPVATRKEQGPRFDLVRVDETGAAVIAGKAKPMSEVQVTIGATPLETVRADQNGAFVALVQLPAGDKPQTMGLKQLEDGEPALDSTQTVLVVPPQLDAVETTPTIVLADAQGASVLQPGRATTPAKIATHPLSLEAISYDQGGAVVLAGRGRGDKFVRVYVDNQPVETEPVPEDGNWRVVLPSIAQGVYTLRVDQISESGVVVSRVESPFKRESPLDVAAAAKVAPDNSTVVVQPGHTLWALALDTYGDGVKYVQIFHANRDRIRDADLIYPGQVFDLPK